ncbi:YbaB/EbfC family nucleoid-associated protein [Urbifossiella limnaea]|uniref:Nucleoid-associated protein ETAA1_25730 n=1 Tax=Urbifossiella limnaea TaxID=2528023 RepID=A0A517XSZ9_9BACT|nr:YbaB/EbfC family nucleoid-associated protein [Urbifossiella limnaea]QDU20617.1 Nucleoid-associated protein YbaB [Urbifossiella limnaea]
MFGKLGSLMSLMGNSGKLKEEMEKLNTQLGTIVAEGAAGAGYVTAKVNGRMEVVSVAITPDAMTDREMLEDLVAAAVNNAMAKAREQVATATAKMAENMGLPPGMLGGGLPGLS